MTSLGAAHTYMAYIRESSPGGSAVLAREFLYFSILCRNRLQISLSVFSLALDLLFDCSHVLDYSTRTVLQSSAETISNQVDAP